MYPGSFQVQDNIFTNEKIRITFLGLLFRKVIGKYSQPELEINRLKITIF
jgi:hypothetical protein